VCAPCELEVGVRLRVDGSGPCYVRAKSLECVLGTPKNWRFKRVSLLRFFSRLKRNEVPPRTGANSKSQENPT